MPQDKTLIVPNLLARAGAASSNILDLVTVTQTWTLRIRQILGPMLTTYLPEDARVKNESAKDIAIGVDSVI